MVTCEAKTRKGTPCQRPAGWGTDHIGSGKCKLHGGKSSGAPKGNKNAVTTGEFETIWVDALTTEEQSLFENVITDALFQIDQEIKLFDIRERRMLIRIKTLMEDDKMLPDEKREAIQRLEDALTRIQERKAKYIEMKGKLDPTEEDEEDDGFIDALKGRASEVWKREQQEDEEEST